MREKDILTTPLPFSFRMVCVQTMKIPTRDPFCKLLVPSGSAVSVFPNLSCALSQRLLHMMSCLCRAVPCVAYLLGILKQKRTFTCRVGKRHLTNSPLEIRSLYLFFSLSLLPLFVPYYYLSSQSFPDPPPIFISLTSIGVF